MEASAEPIPFRTDPAIAGGQVAEILLVTVVLLATTFALLAYVRKKGWLARWLGRSAALPARREGWSVESQRISRQTRIHTLCRAGETLVLVESSASIALAGLGSAAAMPEANDDAV